MLVFSFLFILFVLAHSSGDKKSQSPSFKLKTKAVINHQTIQRPYGLSKLQTNTNSKQKELDAKYSLSSYTVINYIQSTRFNKDKDDELEKRNIKQRSQAPVKSYKVNGNSSKTKGKERGAFSIRDQRSADQNQQGSHKNNNVGQNKENSTLSDDNHTHNAEERFKIATFNFHHVGIPMVAALWVLVASLAKIGKFTFITSRLYLRTFCDIRLDTEHITVTEGHQMNLVLTVSMHNYS